MKPRHRPHGAGFRKVYPDDPRASMSGDCPTFSLQPARQRIYL
jgi:hypothetical protein